MKAITQNIKAVIFDVDGLLIDSEPYWLKTTEAFFAKHNKPFRQEIQHHLLGRGLRDVVEYFKREHGFVGETEDLIIERKEMLYAFLLPNIALMEGAAALIHSLHEKKLPLAIATSGHSRKRTKEILGKFGLASHFSVLVSGEDVVNAKPAPDIYFKAAELLQVDPKDCLVLEDAPNGVIAGKSAGMIVYGINKEEKIYNELKIAGANQVMHSLKEIL